MKERWDAMTPEQRELRRAFLRAAWTPEKREQQRQVAVQRWREANPGRAAVQDAIELAIAAGTLVPGPCDGCGGEGKAIPDYESGEVKGWRCQACWDALKTARRSERAAQ